VELPAHARRAHVDAERVDVVLGAQPLDVEGLGERRGGEEQRGGGDEGADHWLGLSLAVILSRVPAERVHEGSPSFTVP
jgi:hypothetical protein